MMSRSRAFTLIEVMVALFVLALTFISVMGTSSHVSRAVTSLEEKTFALWVAHNAQNEINLGLHGEVEPHLQLHGDQMINKKRWYWQAVSEPQMNYQRITVWVSEKRGGDVITSIEFLYFKPPVVEEIPKDA